MTLASLAFTSFLPDFSGFEDIDLVRVIEFETIINPRNLHPSVYIENPMTRV
jgi:hypothetical protein